MKKSISSFSFVRRSACLLPSLLMLNLGTTPVRADIVICNNWGWNANRNPPSGTSLQGVATYINGYSDPTVVTILQDKPKTYGSVIFPNASTALDGLTASFGVDLHNYEAANAADGISFSYSLAGVNAAAAQSELGDTNALTVQFLVETYNAKNFGTLKVVYENQTVVNEAIPLLFSANNLPATCRAPALFSMYITPDGNLTWQLQSRDATSGSCNIVGTYGNTVALGKSNPLAGFNGPAYFGARSGSGAVFGELDGIDIRGFVYPTISSPPTILTANQDQPSGSATLNISSPDPTWPAANVIVQAYADNSTLLPSGNINLSGSGATRQVIIQGGTHQYGDTTLNLLVTYPNSNWTNSYKIQVSIAKNIPPTIGGIPASITLPQGRSLALPFSYSSTQWSLSRQISVVAAENGTMGQTHSLHVVPPDSIPDGPGTVNSVLTFTPKLNTSGNTTLQITVTDGAGDQAVSTMTATVVPQNTPPSVTGERTAISFNENSAAMQFAEDTVGLGSLGGNFTIEAWVRPSALPVNNWNPIVSLGAAATAQYAMLALQGNGIPAFAGSDNDAIPASGPAAPLNGWSHVAVAVNGETAELYFNGQLFSTMVLPRSMNVQNGNFAVGFDEINRKAFQGQIDELRIWNVTRTATDIKNNFRSKVSPAAPGLVRYYDFDADFIDFTLPFGVTAYDSAATTRNLKLINLPAYVPGVALDTTFIMPQNASVSLPLVAQNVQGTSWYGTAGALREAFIGSGGTALNIATNTPDFPGNPYILTLMGDAVEIGPGGMVNGLERLRGYLLPPQTGNYTFWIASHFEGQLWVSTDETPAAKKLIASSPENGVAFRQWTANPSQKSAPISLTAGQRYYFEVLHASLDAGLGNPTYVSLQWQLPDGTLESPLPAYRVQPPAPTAGTNGPVQLVISAPPANGTIGMTNNILTYNPRPYYFGTDDLFYYVVDAGRTSAPAHLVFQVQNSNDRPVAGNNNALFLDGVSGRIQTDTSLSLSNRSFTLEAWAQRPDPTAREWLISQGGQQNYQGLLFGWETGSHFKFGFWGDDLQVSTAFTDTGWHHWAATYDLPTQTRKIYLDGLLVAQDITTNILQTPPNSQIHIGSQFGAAPFFHGGISEVRIWDYARTVDQLQQNLNIPLSGNEDGLMLYYRLNEGNGLIVNDSSMDAPYVIAVNGSLFGGITWTTNNNFFGTVTVPRNIGQAYVANRLYLPGFDPDGTDLTYYLVDGHTNGFASIPSADQPFVNYTPNLYAKGADILRYYVKNAAGVSSGIATLFISITSTNLPPTISSFLDQAVEEEDPPLTLTFVISDIDLPASSLTVTGSCSNPTLLPPSGFSFAGTNNIRTVTLDPADGEIGLATVTITVSDGQRTASQQFKYQVKGRLAFAPVDIGQLTGQAYSEANDINAAGMVVGFSATDTQRSHSQGFVYTGFGPLAQTLPSGTLGGDGSELKGINGSGVSVGWSISANNSATNVIIANPGPPVTLTSRGTMVGAASSVATKIDDNGYLTGFGEVGGGVQHPFFASASTNSGGLVDIGLPAGAKRAFGLSLNNSQVIVGYSVTDGGQTNAFVYDAAASNFTTLFIPAAATGSVATTINDANEVGGYIFTGGQMHAAIAFDTTWTDLGDVFGGGAARINDMNLLRQAVGTALDTNNNWRAFYYENGRTYDLNALLPLDSGWTLVDARAINDQAQIVGVGQKDGQTRAFLLFPASEIGRRVFRPTGTLPTMPQITLLQGNPGDNALNSFFWSDNDQKLFAVRPVAALINWHTGRQTIYTNETQFGDQVIRQVYTNEITISNFSYNVWPKDANIQVASAPVELQPAVPGFNYSLVEMIYSTVDGAAVDGNKNFDTPFNSSGYSVFRYLISNGQAPNPQLQKAKFDVTRTTSWDDPKFLESNLVATVGVVVTNSAHDDYPGRTGWMVITNAYYDGVGANAAFVRTNRSGNIIPVNAVTNRDDFVVAWYARDLLGVAWPSLPKKYQLQWPTNATHLVIASGKGFGPIDSTLYPNAQIYNQPDVNQAGFNPNEEHALYAPTLAGLGTSLFALRCDLNQARPGIPSDSAPFVLLKYQDPATQLWLFRTFQVVAEEDPYYFSYQGTAGTEIQPPYPLSVLPLSPSNYVASGPAWRDYVGRFYALAGGERLDKSSIVMRYYYPLQPGFWYDLNNDGTNDLPAGASVPWLSLLNPNQDLNQPVDTLYDIGWPGDLPTLAIGETLYGAAHGLPDVQDMASVQIAYDSLDAILAAEGINGITQLARLFDSMSPRKVPVSSTAIFANLSLSTPDSATGFQTFSDLPFYLRVRLYYDPVAQQLCFQGFTQAQTVGPALTLINVMSERERNRIQELDGTNGTTPFDTLVQQLYVMTRNPNQLDIQPRDGQPDDALYIGLTYDATGTNVTFEQLGSGPKALTAGIPQFNSQVEDGQWLNFDGAPIPSVSVEFNRTNAFANVTNNFTIEFWARPSAGRSSSNESDDDIQSIAHVGGRFAIMPNQGDLAYGEGHATAGISIGTNGVSVFQHHNNYLPTPLVYDTPITNWTHVAVAYAGGRPSLYINGVLVHIGLPLLTNVVPFVHPGIGIGGAQSRTDFGFYAGDIDDVRVWNYTVPQSQIQVRMFQQLSGYESGLVAYWPLNEGKGTNVTDHSMTQLNGVIWNNNSIDDSAWAAGPGPVFVTPRYEVLAENNDPSLPGQPVSLHVIQVGSGPYQGSIQTILPDNVLDERVTLRHNADFGGDPRQLEFQWFYHPADGGAAPSLPDPANPNANGWVPFPDSGLGVNDITIGEGNLSGRITMSDNWFIMRYRGYVIDGSTNWSPWVGDAASTTTTRPMLVEGWIKRVLSGITLFNQRESDFANFQVNTLVSSIAQAGPRYEGDVALNPGALDTPGLIQIYQTVLNRGESLSINGTPPVDYDPADQALLLAAGNISDLYMLLGNEAAADAADPTIGLNPPLPDGGSLAASMFAFENQVSSLLEEELCLLRGRDDSSAGVGAAPVYNRLFWNFTGGDGEVAYVATYNMSDYNADGFINAADAAILYPQGHGDAWGHYLTALTTYYGLLQNTNFSWTPQTEDVVLGGVTLEVGYLHERKFAGAAAARAQTGAKLLERTYRLDYSTTPTGLWAGYKDADLRRAWGTTEWGWRAGSGAYFDWLAANAILPAVDTNHTGIEKIDRTTVPELAQIANAANQIQTTLDSADSGYNPLGLSPNAVPFDLDPSLLLTDFYRETHFDQIYDRAIASLQNAVTTFNQASELTDALRAQADDESNFGGAVELQELAYRNQLIGLFGYPYSGDIGPNAPNPSGYVGPDLYHWMYIDATDATPQNNAPGTNFTVLYKPFQDGNFQFAPDITNSLAGNSNSILQVNYPVAADGYLFQAPATWGARRAEGSLQTALRNMVQAKVSYQQAVNAYNQQVTSIAQQLDLLQARYNLNSTQIRILNSKLITLSTMNSAILVAKAAELAADQFGHVVQKVEESIVAAMPVVAGLAIDVAAPIRGLAVTGTITPETTLDALKNTSALLEAGFDFSKDETDLVLDTQGAEAQISFDQKQAIADLQTAVRQEYGLRLSLFQQAEALRQTVQTYLTALAQAQQALEQRLIYRQFTAGSVAEMRYRDFAFRIFRNDALEQYDTQFGLAARYVFLAAKAFDYEVNLDTAGAADLAVSVVSERNLGQVQNGVPSVSRNGLASILAKLKQNFDVLKPSLGLNNTQNEAAQFSLRTEWQRITNSTSWLALLQNSVVSNLWDVPEFRQYCRPFAPEGAGAQPGMVINIPGTTIAVGQNFFGRPLAPQDYSYDPSEFSTRIRSVAVWFSGYDNTLLVRSPRVYLVPVGADILRSPDSSNFTPRTWQVVEQRIPIPFPASSSISTASLVNTLNLTDQFADWTKHSAILAYPDNGYDPSNFNPSTRLVGRSVANTRWILIIPGAYLNADPNQGLANFVNSVTDIKLDFQTYSASGN